eukprot:TRINITY_DN4411_c0_g1_i1.p1 TRINITY_DN4411_c0_g1~~TRINITY_DN4411_c0_g1_i1.p1  ORF type:complete len:296 (+),score=69.52 TRINITY_DN4411_c0_g1_i1:109-996(+)
MGCGASSAKQQSHKSHSTTVEESKSQVTVTSSTPQKATQDQSQPIQSPLQLVTTPNKSNSDELTPAKQSSSTAKDQTTTTEKITAISDHDDLVNYDDNADRCPSIAAETSSPMKKSTSHSSSTSDASTDVHLSGLSSLSRNGSPMSEGDDVVFSPSPSPDTLAPMVIDVPLKRPSASAKKSALQIRLEKQSRERQARKGTLTREEIEHKLKRAEENQRKQNEDKILRAKGLTTLKPLGAIKKHSSSSTSWGSQSLPPLSNRTPLKSLGNTQNSTTFAKTAAGDDLFEDVLAALEE